MTDVVANQEWLDVLNEIDGCPTIEAYVRELAQNFEHDGRRSSSGLLKVQPLNKEQSKVLEDELVAYFQEAPEDWQYCSVAELKKSFKSCSLLQPSKACYFELDVAFLFQNDLKNAKVEIRKEALKRKQESNEAQLTLDIKTATWNTERMSELQKKSPYKLTRITGC